MMGDSAAAGESCAALCIIFCTESLFSWCNYKAYGGGGSSSTAGCCTSCCKSSFDDDEFENEERRIRAQHVKAEGAKAGHANQQPSPQGKMATKPDSEAAK